VWREELLARVAASKAMSEKKKPKSQRWQTLGAVEYQVSGRGNEEIIVRFPEGSDSTQRALVMAAALFGELLYRLREPTLRK